MAFADVELAAVVLVAFPLSGTPLVSVSHSQEGRPYSYRASPTGVELVVRLAWLEDIVGIVLPLLEMLSPGLVTQKKRAFWFQSNGSRMRKGAGWMV